MKEVFHFYTEKAKVPDGGLLISEEDVRPLLKSCNSSYGVIKNSGNPIGILLFNTEKSSIGKVVVLRLGIHKNASIRNNMK